MPTLHALQRWTRPAEFGVQARCLGDEIIFQAHLEFRGSRLSCETGSSNEAQTDDYTFICYEQCVYCREYTLRSWRRLRRLISNIITNRRQESRGIPQIELRRVATTHPTLYTFCQTFAKQYTRKPFLGRTKLSRLPHPP